MYCYKNTHIHITLMYLYTYVYTICACVNDILRDWDVLYLECDGMLSHMKS